MSGRPDVEARITFLDDEVERPRRALAAIAAVACGAAVAIALLISDGSPEPTAYERGTWVPTPSATDLEAAAARHRNDQARREQQRATEAARVPR